jgi:hypothetical protein
MDAGVFLAPCEWIRRGDSGGWELVWHESAVGPGKSLVLTTPEAKELKWSNKGRFKVKLGEDETKEVNLTVPAAAFGG